MEAFVGLNTLRLQFDGPPMSNRPSVKSNVKQLIECVDQGSVITNTTLEMGGDDGSLELTNAFTELGTVRNIRGTGAGAKAHYGGLQAGLHKCRVSEWMLLEDCVTAGEATIPNKALFFNAAKNALSFKDAKGVVHALC